MIHFIADPHFGHQNILKFSKRPYETIEEHDEALRRNWNATIKPTDEVYIIGDLTMSRSGEYANQLLSSLNGRKYLIKGNHESYLDDPAFDQSLYEWVKDYYTLTYHKVRFVLFHYPILEWDDYFRKSIHLYGHVHNTRQAFFETMMDRRSMNVGVDMIDYKPISIDTILTRIDPEPDPR